MSDTKKPKGDQFYYSRGFVRLMASMDEQSLRAIKIIAIQRELTIIEVVQEALNDFLKNPDALIPEFLPESNGSSLKTFIPKELQKKVKIVALEKFGRKFGALTGAVLSKWAKEKSLETQPVETQEGPAKDFLEKVQKLQDVKSDTTEAVTAAQGPL